MSTREAERLLSELLIEGAVPSIAAGRLRIDAPPGVLTPERHQALAICLPELRALVAARWRNREECRAVVPCRRWTACAQPRDGRSCLASPVCCLCGAPLPVGHRYLCVACGTAGEVAAVTRFSQGDRA